jgi:hypothetical protein
VGLQRFLEAPAHASAGDNLRTLSRRLKDPKRSIDAFYKVRLMAITLGIVAVFVGGAERFPM